MKRIIFYLITISLFAACQPQDAENKTKNTGETEEVKEKVFPVKVQSLNLSEVSKTINYSANLIPFEELYMAPAQPGKITKIYVEIGDKATKGKKLVQMDDTQLEQAKIQLESLEKDYQRIKALKEEGSIAEQQYDQIKTQVDVLKSNIEFLKENSALYAPFSGVISGKYFEDGETFAGAPNTQAGKAAIVTLQQISSLKAMVNVPEKYYTKLSEGMKIELFTDVYPDTIFSGEILNVYPTINPLTRSFQVELKIPNKELLLRPGMYSKVSIVLGKTETMVV